MTETAIRIENLTRDFGPVRALDGLSLEVPSGIIFGSGWRNHLEALEDMGSGPLAKLKEDACRLSL